MKLTVHDRAIEADGPRLVLDTLDASESVLGRLLWQVVEAAASRQLTKNGKSFILKNETMEIRLEV